MEATRSNVLDMLKRQKLLTQETQLVQLMDAVCQRNVVDKESLREFVSDNFDVTPKSEWVRQTWLKVHILANTPCTDIVLAQPVEKPCVEPFAMVQLSTAMRGVMYEGQTLPIVAPTKDDGVADSTEPEFDRNDWYLTNSGDMEKLLSEPRGVFDNRLCVLAVSTVSGRTYITWCRRKDSGTILTDINSGTVRLSSSATAAIRGGDLFNSRTILDDDLGQLLERDIDDVLYNIEHYIGAMSSREPRGFNVAPRHLVHRSLRLLGGNWETLYTYDSWHKAEDKLRLGVKAFHDKLSDARRAQHAMLSVMSIVDEDVLSAVQHKVKAKTDKVKEALEYVRRLLKDVCACRSKLLTVTLNGIAECLMDEMDVPVKLLDTKTRLKADEHKGLLEDLEAEMKVMDVDVPNAMHLLGIVKSPSDLTRKDIKKAWQKTQLKNHSDKNGSGNKYAADITAARDTLYAAIDSVRST